MLCCHSPAWAGSKVVAVVAFEGVEIDDELFLKQVASNVSKGLLRVLDPARYQVLQVERPSTIESPPLCTNDCELEWAAAQAADYVLYGSITQIAGRFAVTLHLRSVGNRSITRQDQRFMDDRFQLRRELPTVAQYLLHDAGLGRKPPKPEDSDSWGPPPKPGIGYLVMETEPAGLRYELDAKHRHLSSSEKRELAQGEHHIQVVDPCFRGTKQRYRFWVLEGLTERVTFPVQERVAGVDFRVRDWNGAPVEADIFIDDVKLQQTEKQIVGICRKTARIEHQGAVQKIQLNLEESQFETIEVRLPRPPWRWWWQR